MNDKQWEGFVKKIRLQIELCYDNEVVIPDDVLMLVEMLIDKGQNLPYYRMHRITVIDSIKAMMKVYPNFQFFRSSVSPRVPESYYDVIT